MGPVSELNRTLGSKLSLSCSDLMNHRCSEALMCHIILPQRLLSLRFPLSHSLSLLLSSLSLLPGASCASSHILLLTFTPFVYSLYLSHLILSASSLLFSLKSECLSHPSGNKHCQVSLEGGVCVGV